MSKIFIYGGINQISAEDPAEISMTNALETLDKLPTAEEMDGIYVGFVNERDEIMQIIRYETNDWFIDFPIFENDDFSSTTQYNDLPTDLVKEIVQKFFKGSTVEDLEILLDDIYRKKPKFDPKELNY